MWTRKIAGSVLALFLVVSLVAGIPAPASAAGWGRFKNFDKFMQKAGQNIAKQSDLRFGDLSDALWALASIAKMRGLGVVNGYDGNLFRPNSSVTQAEALTMMVRAFNLEDEANALSARFGATYQSLDRTKGPAWKNSSEDENEVESEAVTLEGTILPVVPVNTRWALGCVLLAVDQGWVKLSECYPDKPATRAWISKVMVRALGYEDEAQALMDAGLDFTDAAAIPADSVGYVAQAVEIGLFEGYDDGTFQPNKPVTRAEMATILDRFLNEELPQDTPYLVTGVIQDVSDDSITVMVGTTEVTYSISEDALVVINREPADVTDLKVGDTVEVMSNGSGVALLITLKGHSTTPAPVTTQVTGTIVGLATPAAITLQVQGQANKTYALATNCTLKSGSHEIEFSDLVIGDHVKVTLQNGKAVAIALLDSVTETVTGVIYTITTKSSGTTIVVKDGSDSTTLALSEDVEITFDGDELEVSDLRTGDEIEATVADDEVTSIDIVDRDVETWGDFQGEITSITETADETVIIVDDGDDEHDVIVIDGTSITFGSDELTRDDLRLGDVVQVLMNDDTADEMRVISRAS